jgi:phospholipid/cholesterol/gamma-HCH transport system substrate-binding protein
MQKRAPTLGNILVIILFALSCFGLLLFLWESFGGALPLKPKGYRMTIAFQRVLALTNESEVRISGVDIGHVVSLKIGKDGRSHATLEIDSQDAPIRADMHAIVRQKTLLGETYVQLIPEGIPLGKSGPFLPDGGQLADSQVEPSVTLDDILASLNTKTRAAFQVWQQSVEEGINGRGEAINNDFATLNPFVQSANGLVSVLASQEGAVTALVHNTGVVFTALAGRDHQLEGLISNGNHTFQAAAEGSQAFAEAFRALPRFENSGRVALKELDKFAADVNPYYEEFRPAELQLSKLVAAAKPFTPPFDHFLTSLGPLTKAAKQGLPDVAKSLNLTVPLLENLSPVLHNFDPFLQYTGEYVPEVQAFFANFTAASEAHDTNSDDSTAGVEQHYLRSMQAVTPQSLAVYSQRIGTDRANPYLKPGAFSTLGSGLSVFSASPCANSAPSVGGPPNATVTQGIIEQLIELHVANAPESANSVPAPPCLQQSPFTFNGQTSQYPHVVYSASTPGK